jgi:hypothetical protein
LAGTYLLRWQTREVAIDFGAKGPYDAPITGKSLEGFEYWTPPESGESVPLEKRMDYELDYQEEVEAFCDACGFDPRNFFERAKRLRAPPPPQPDFESTGGSGRSSE